MVLNALHIQQWPTVEHKPKLMPELVVAVQERICGVSQSAIVAIRLSASDRDWVLRSMAACTAAPQKPRVTEHTMDTGTLLPNQIVKDPFKTDCVVIYPSVDNQRWEKEGRISSARAPLQARPHPGMGHPYFYIRHETFHSIGYGVPAWVMRESLNLPPMSSRNAHMGLDQLGEARYVC